MLVFGQFMAVLDASIVNVAAPAVQSDLHASGSALQLVIAGYTIVYAMLLITGARLGAMFGPGRMYLAGIALFTAASLACGAAWSTWPLVAFRGLQGAGAALLVPQVLTLIQQHFDGERRARAIGLYQAAIAGGAVVGQVLGGVLVSADLFGADWRPVFLVNVPVGVVLLVAGSRLLRGESRDAAVRLDVPGVLVLAPAMVALVVPLVLGHERDWPLWGWLVLTGGVLLLGVFALVERRVAARGGAPLVTAAVLRARGMLVAAVALAIGVGTYNGFLFSLALHLQSGLGDTALRAGLTYAPCALGFAVTSTTWHRVPERLRPWLVPAGFAVVAAGYAGMEAALRGGDRGGAGFLIALALMGLGQGAALGPLMSHALSRVRPEHAGAASGLLVTLMQFGAVLGVAIYGTVFLSATGPGAHASAHAASVTLLALAGTAAAGAVWGWAMITRRSAREPA
ncbi:MAG: MFS transporter [Streptomycetaceae bacterium]|nr:MFS transporter [Streptomycetaceae bacterium]